MKWQNRKTGLLLALLLAVSMILSACSETDITESQSSVSGGSTENQSADAGTIAELQEQIAELQAENEALRNQLQSALGQRRIPLLLFIRRKVFGWDIGFGGRNRL